MSTTVLYVHLISSLSNAVATSQYVTIIVSSMAPRRTLSYQIETAHFWL